MTTATLQQLLVTPIEMGQAIAAEPDDPMHAALKDAAGIEGVDLSGDDGLTITLADGEQLRLLIAD